jgi:hypothetical protein
MFISDDEILSKVEQQLHKNCPSPENELAELSQLAASLPENEMGARIRILVLDIDDLVAQARWNLGQALLLMEQYPQIVSKVELDDPIAAMLAENEIPSKALLLLRAYLKDADKVLYADLTESRRSGTVAGWVFHMMIDDAIYRTIAALDRLAQILWYAANLPTTHPNGERVKIYFRSKKMKQIDKAIQNTYSKQILEISDGKLIDYVIGYRDGFSHDMKIYSHVAGSRPTDEWVASDGTRFIIKYDKWDADTLFALANATYHQLTDVLRPAIAICEVHLMTKE